MTVGLDAQAHAFNPLFGKHGAVQGLGEFGLQPFARHFQDVVDTRVALHWLQKKAGAPVQILNVTQTVDQCCHGHDFLQQRLLSQFLQ